MSTRTVSIVLIVGGLLAALAFIFADVLGVGTNPTVFGFKQTIGTAVGAVAFVAGLVLLRQKRQS